MAAKSLSEFVKQAWLVLKPQTPLIWHWGLEAICEHLEAVTRGEITRLLILVQPRIGKSSIASVCWPAWEWISRPDRKFLMASYAESVATDFNVEARRLVQSGWYQRNWPEIQFAGDANTKGQMTLTAGGSRLAVGLGGALTGRGGSRLILDDPHNLSESVSDVMREEAIRWFNDVFSTRLDDPSQDSIVVIMQ